MLEPARDNPVLVEVHRGDQVESIHRGSVIALNTAGETAAGETVFAVGDTSRLVYPRSALKIFQAIPLLESGAADHFGVSDAEIALACASHNAEKIHTRAVIEWLRRLDLDGDDLECGRDWPLMEDAARELAAHGEQPARVHHNCSGKHAGMLTLAKFMNAETRGYGEYHHPVQQAWMQTLSELIDLDVFSQPWERDGCGLPAVCLPLTKLAQAFACYADPRKVTGTGKRGIAMERIIIALRAHPHLLAGTGRCCTDVIRESAGRIVIKTGAEGVYGGVIPHLGIGFALKIDDGATRAAEVAVGALLKKLGALTPASEAQLQHHFQPTVANSHGYTTGRIAVSPNW